MFYGDKSTLFEQDKQRQHHPDKPLIAIIGGDTGLTIANQLADMSIAIIHCYHQHPFKIKPCDTVCCHRDQVIAMMSRDGGWRLACQSGQTCLASMVILAFSLPNNLLQIDDLLIQNLLAQGLLKPAQQGIELADYPYIVNQFGTIPTKLLCAHTNNGQTKPSDSDIDKLCQAAELAF